MTETTYLQYSKQQQIVTLSRPLNKWMSTLYCLRARRTAATYMSTSDSTLNFLQKAEQAPHIYAATFLINTPKKLSSQLENPIRHRPLTIVASTILLYHCQRVFTYQIHVNKTISLYHYSLVQFYWMPQKTFFFFPEYSYSKVKVCGLWEFGKYNFVKKKKTLF